MRIYNATKAQIEMPLSNGTKLVIPGHSVSGEFMPNPTVVSTFMTSYRPTQIAFIVSGPYEIVMLSNFAGSGEYVVYSIEEAVARFAPKADPTTTTTTTTAAPEPEPVKVEEEVKEEVELEAIAGEEEVKEEETPEVIEEVKEEPAKKAKPGKKARG